MLKPAGIPVRAVSVAGLETCIDLPSHKVAFDLGVCPRWMARRRTVLFTHSHVDHMGAVVTHAARRELLGMQPARYVVPSECHAAFLELLDVWRRLDGSTLACEVVPLDVGGQLELGRDLVARSFRSPHRRPCQGYVLARRRRRLKPELQGLPRTEIRRRAAELGEAVSEETLEPEVAFTGDTLVDVLDREPDLRRARLLILETTFVDERVSVADCRARGHTHLFELAERAELLENEALLLMHFSARYRPEELPELVARALPPSLHERVHLLLPGAAD